MQDVVDAINTPKAVRQSLVPHLSLAEMARRIGIGRHFLWQLECGRANWPAERLARFYEVVAAWRVAPDPRPRKKRKDTGKKHRKRKKLRLPKQEPVPVPHSHGEVVGIG